MAARQRRARWVLAGVQRRGILLLVETGADDQRVEEAGGAGEGCPAGDGGQVCEGDEAWDAMSLMAAAAG
ncbi:hypothetical protein Tdes44962_MAKER07768 [Teratosphaeria destructans]|uniref:Uncharacterized protein n=1 Tax=Teratosphaeria destructans TaxID=418781 RepID=A0A9W7W5W7_9PEZI|nr:hypothetical protein Tdes44962_MAKER07768 [Teratosphaeria destructans]